MSTAISDFILAISAFHACYCLFDFNKYATAGFFIIGVAATLGVRKFSQHWPSMRIVNYHLKASWWATVFGTSAIAAGFHRLNYTHQFANIHMAVGLAVILLEGFFSYKTKDQVTTLVTVASLVSIIGICLTVFNPHGLIGAALYILAGQFIGVTGTWNGFARVDLFHYALALGNVAFMMALGGPQVPIYYRYNLF